MELPCPLHPESAYLDVGTAGRRAQPSVEITLRLQFPWGEIDLPAEGLEIGRDCGQACGAQIDTYDNVSRRHARITTEAATVSVEDLDSTNGTTVNGVRIAPRVPKRVAVGDVLGFGNRLRVSIRSGESE